jgi:enterochelin esterase family protein
MTRTEKVVSPRIQDLARAVEAAEPEAVDTFWKAVAVEGTPMVEPIDGDDGHGVLTFLWRDVDGDTRNVLVQGGPATGEPLTDHVMEQLPGTDVWFRSYRVRTDIRSQYSLSPNDPLTSFEDLETTEEWLERTKTFRPDPLNPDELVWPANDEDPGQTEERTSPIHLPDALPQPWAERRPEVPAGEVQLHRLKSEILGNERRVWIHRPAGVDATDGLLVLLDGWSWAVALPIAPTLDNLVAEGRTPPLTTVMVDAIDMDETRGRELPCHRPFVEFLETELLPWVEAKSGPTPPADRRVIAGQSYGGLAATYAGLEAPHVFGNVLSQSASYWWKRGTEFDIEREWLTRQYAERPNVPVRYFVEIGLEEGPDMVPTNRHMRDVMIAKGYDVAYREYNGGHSWHNWIGGIADGLITLTSRWT